MTSVKPQLYRDSRRLCAPQHWVAGTIWRIAGRLQRDASRAGQQRRL